VTPIFILSMAVLLAGCASGSIGTLPQIADPDRAATIVVARPSGFIGGGRSVAITVDGIEVCELGPGEHVVLPIDPGDHFVGMKLWDLVTDMRQSQTILAVPRQVYYFRIDFAMGFVQLSRTADNEGRELVGKTTPLHENAWKGRPWNDRVPPAPKLTKSEIAKALGVPVTELLE